MTTTKVKELIHVIDRENLRYPSIAPNPAICRVNVFIAPDGTMTLGVINIEWNMVHDIASWTALEEDILEHAKATF